MGALYEDPRVELRTGARVQSVELRGKVATGVRYLSEGREVNVHGDLVALGANAIFNPHILLRSGLSHPELGHNLHEQVSIKATVLLDGLENFQGSTSITGHAYWLYDGPHRAQRPAILIETWNVPRLRNERGRWRQILKLMCILEDTPLHGNRVEIDDLDPTRPAVTFEGRSPRVLDGVRALHEELPGWLAPLPVQQLIIAEEFKKTEAHILGTVVMGDDPKHSVVDRDLVHHDVRNLLVLGGSAFPTCSPANPTLTLSALSLRAAERLMR
jgi:choline dehydrogenase-like flavoprotein